MWCGEADFSLVRIAMCFWEKLITMEAGKCTIICRRIIPFSTLFYIYWLIGGIPRHNWFAVYFSFLWCFCGEGLWCFSFSFFLRWRGSWTMAPRSDPSLQEKSPVKALNIQGKGTHIVRLQVTHPPSVFLGNGVVLLLFPSSHRKDFSRKIHFKQPHLPFQALHT